MENNATPFTGALVIAVNDIPGDALKVCFDVIAEIRKMLGSITFETLSFAFQLDAGPCFYVYGEWETLYRLKDHADANYPQLAAEYEQQ